MNRKQDRERKTGMKRFVRKILPGMLLLLLIVLTAGPARMQAQAASKKTGWVKKNNYFYYYLTKSKKATGYVEIDGKQYLFDSQGRQQVGWRKVGKNVRYFKIKNGAGGFMVVNKTVNGVKLSKKGIAKSNDDVQTKIQLLLGYQKLADRLVKPGMKYQKKLETFFLYARSRPFIATGNAAATKHWDQTMAMIFLQGQPVDCVMAACGFGYLANAVGAKKVKLLLYGHGHCDINDLAYDPTQAKDAPFSQWREYFGVSYKKRPELAMWRNRHARFV